MLYRLTIGQKLLLGFGLLLSLLALSLAGLLMYLARVNSYVDRHQRITIPGVVTAAEMQQTVAEMQTHMHHVLEHQSTTERHATLARVTELEMRLTALLETYRENHAARRHPVLHGMLTAHGRTDLVEEEERTLADLSSHIDRLAKMRRQTAEVAPSTAGTNGQAPATESDYEQAVAAMSAGIHTVIDVHRKIDMEMKLEGDRLVTEARAIASALGILFALVILGVYLAMTRLVARPLARLADTADRVAHQDLTVQFEQWPSADEVGRLAASLSAMLSTLRERGTALMHKTKELEAFTYSVAHDLKGPLREIEGFSSLLEKRFADAPEPEVRHHLDVIRRSTLRLTSMIDALLKYSRLEQQTLPRARFNLGEMVAHLVAERQPDGQPRRVKIDVELPFSDLYGEPVSVRQALHNLLDNAIKFSRRASQPEIVIGGFRTAQESVVWVADNGVGIGEQDRERMFNLFERVHPSDEFEGTGVGLAIVKLVMDKHGGRVWVESTPGTGTRFYLAFPERPAP
ncbi:MAG: HAMP domain-containing sensor histidine kinase [Nitrospiraceae bacterium]